MGSVLIHSESSSSLYLVMHSTLLSVSAFITSVAFVDRWHYRLGDLHGRGLSHIRK